uniref:Uncharacterized protein n=1 Tax=Anguilla anguilla TaxID=7936 RepID=A0A0E9WYV4_ANGAN
MWYTAIYFIINKRKLPETPNSEIQNSKILSKLKTKKIQQARTMLNRNAINKENTQLQKLN